MAEADLAIGAQHAQQEPDLFLPDAQRRAPAADVLLRQTIAQPASGRPDHLDLFRAQTDFLGKFAVHGFGRGFIRVHPPLRELPGILTNAPGPQQLPDAIRQYDPDVGPKSIRINHLMNLPGNLPICPILP